jgi:hypothetical protein
MKKIFFIAIISIFTISFSVFSSEIKYNSVDKNRSLQIVQKKQKKEDKFFKKCTDDCMSKKTRCNKEGNKEKSTKKMMHTRGFCDTNFRNCNFECNTRYGKKR